MLIGTKTRCRGLAVAALILMIAGCTSPPSVAPLLRSAGQAIAQEQSLLQDDAQRDSEYLAQTQAALAEAFEADLREQKELSPQWVLDANTVYVAAREALVRHDAQLQRQREIRVDNLRAAVQAQQRAIELLEKQDQLIASAGTAGLDLWRLASPTSNPTTEKSK